MTTIVTVTDFRHSIGKHLKLAETEPVLIHRSNGVGIVMVSYEIFVEMYQEWVKANPEYEDKELINEIWEQD